MSYRVWWFEDDDPAHWPARAMGAVTTHDLPTVAGVLRASDLEAQRRLELDPNEEAADALRAKLLTRARPIPGRRRDGDRSVSTPTSPGRRACC